MLCSLWPAQHAPAASIRLDGFAYGTDDEVRTAWISRGASPAPRRAEGPSGGVSFPIRFAGDLDRVYWDHPIRLDLSPFRRFELDITCPDPGALRHLGLYFKSGDGWYVCNRVLQEAGRQRVVFPKDAFSVEGHPAGWNRIDTIRLSPWKGADRTTELVSHRLTALSGGIWLVRGTSSTPNTAERTFSARVTERISRWLDELQVGHSVVTDEDVTASNLHGVTMLLLCYNPNPSASELRTLQTFMSQGGKVIVFYSASEPLAKLMDVKLGPYLRTEDPGKWSAFRFITGRDRRLPARVVQASMNIRPVYPVKHSSRVLAFWENANGKRAREPAWVESPQGAWMTHVLLEGDATHKKQMLLAILGHLDPDVWAHSARVSLSQAGRLGPFTDIAATAQHLRAHAMQSPSPDRVIGLVARSESLFRQMRALYRVRRYADVVVQGTKLRAGLIEAYALIQSSRAGEFRGVWEHDGVGWFPGNWSRTCRLLADHGITAIFPNMVWGGLAHYASSVLPRSATFRRYGDQMAQCVAAAHAAGLEVHVWLVCWNLQGAPDEFVQRMRREDRVQLDRNGKPLPWLNPAHPANRELAISCLAELVSRYPVDGIHLDYVRYPGAAVCRSPTTRAQFEKWLGRKAAGWPASAEAGGALADAYQRFRADQITLFVRGVHQQVREKRPGLRISAAVFKNYPECIRTVGQDWGRWLREGYVDFVSPMNYTTSTDAFRRMTQAQLAVPGARGKVYPGLGVTANESELRPDQVIDQINVLRSLGAGGFLLFDLSQTLRDETLPALSLGVTRP